jgi:hypothetical protein
MGALSPLLENQVEVFGMLDRLERGTEKRTLNEATIHADLTAEPELRYSQTGTAVVSSSVQRRGDRQCRATHRFPGRRATR